MKPKIGIMDYGVGNLHSIRKGLENAGAKCVIVREAKKLLNHDCIVLPGVGAFDASMMKILPVRDELNTRLDSGTPALGICIGFQILFEKSEEEPEVDGLGLVKGSVRMLKQRVRGETGESIKIPHMGWNTVRHIGSGIFDKIRQEQEFYFVHSYICVPDEKTHVIAETTYGRKFASAIRYKNTFGVQFHPEKSADPGLKILENFVKISEEVL